MPEQFDPEWEYYVGNEEIEEIIYANSPIVNPFDYSENTQGKNEVQGFRFASTINRLRWLPTKLGKEKKTREYISKYPIVKCYVETCNNEFRMRWKGHKYCPNCAHPGGIKTLPTMRRCRICPGNKRFVPKYSKHRFCSKECANKAFIICHKSCVMCGNPVPMEKRRNHNPGLYCSTKCKKKRDNKTQREKRKHLQKPNYKLIHKEIKRCAYQQCMKEFKPISNQSKYCSRICAGIMRRKNSAQVMLCAGISK